MPENGGVSSLIFARAGDGEIHCLAIWPAGSVWSCLTAVPGVHSNPPERTEEQRQIGGEGDE